MLYLYVETYAYISAVGKFSAETEKLQVSTGLFSIYQSSFCLAVRLATYIYILYISILIYHKCVKVD